MEEYKEGEYYRINMKNEKDDFFMIGKTGCLEEEYKDLEGEKDDLETQLSELEERVIDLENKNEELQNQE